MDTRRFVFLIKKSYAHFNPSDQSQSWSVLLFLPWSSSTSFIVFFLFVFSFCFQISPQMCVYLFLMFLPPYHTFQFGTFDTNTQEHFAAAPELKSEKESGGRREGERPGDFPTVDACVLGVTLVNNLLPILQLGCTFRTLQTMKTAGFVQPNCQSLLCCRWWKYQTSEPWVDISIWISSAQLNHSRPPTDNSCNIHSH